MVQNFIFKTVYKNYISPTGFIIYTKKNVVYKSILLAFSVAYSIFLFYLIITVGLDTSIPTELIFTA